MQNKDPKAMQLISGIRDNMEKRSLEQRLICGRKN